MPDPEKDADSSLVTPRAATNEAASTTTTTSLDGIPTPVSAATPAEPAINAASAMDKKAGFDAQDEVDGVPPEQGSSSVEIKLDEKLKKAGKAKKNKAGKTKVKGKKKSKKAKKQESSSESSDSSESDSSSESESSESDESESESLSESESESESEADEPPRRSKRALKTKRTKPKKQLKSRSTRKARRSRDESAGEETEAETEGDSFDDADMKELLRRLTARLGLKGRRRDEEDEAEDHQEDDSRQSRRSKAKSRGSRSKRKLGKKKKKGSRVDFKRVDQLWDSNIHNYKLQDTAEETLTDEYDEYVFNVRRRFDWEGKYTHTVVDIKSAVLKAVLAEIIVNVKGISLVEETPAIDPNMLFLYMPELEEHIKQMKKKLKKSKKKKQKKELALKIAHAKVMLKYLNEDYAKTKATLYPLLESNLITFDLLWALFKPNTIAFTTTYGQANEPRAIKVEYSEKHRTFNRGEFYSIEGKYLEYDGKEFGMGTLGVEIDGFKGSRKITSLECYPLKYHKDPDGLKQQLVERGKKFVALRGMQYRLHKGMSFFKRKKAVAKVNTNGRVMVDPAIFRRINPNYLISNVKPMHLEEEESESDESEECCDDSEDTGSEDDEEKPARKRARYVLDEHGKVQLLDPESENETQNEKIEPLEQKDEKTEKEPSFTDDQLMLASSLVLGFSFNEKMWLEFTVSGIQDIQWNEGAFESLVLPIGQKEIVKALVESHTFHAAENIDDVIQGKGKGLVAVLHGPPGTGKTLTAEGIAELLRRPLYMVSTGELGTDPARLETSLNQILDIAHSWGAVLLLDEADVFLETRSTHDIHRNALVSIFLRLLEYFQGILFLTTNRVETFDDAFQSRIHVALKYDQLSQAARKTVWKQFLARVKKVEGVVTAEFKESDFNDLSRKVLNGRQIKNIVRTAQALAANNKDKLSMVHIKKVLDVQESFDRDLKGGTGYEDAMRSYS